MEAGADTGFKWGGGARFNLEQTDLGIKRCAADEIFFDFPVLHKVFPLKFYWEVILKSQTKLYIYTYMDWVDRNTRFA